MITGVSIKELSPLAKNLKGFSDKLNMYEQTVASLLGEKYNMSAKEFMVSIMNIVKKTPKLLDCDPKTLFGAILLSAELGLKPNTPEGFAWILPYGKDAQFQIGYKGLIEIAYRSPIVKSIKGVPVYENEFYIENEDGTFIHIPYTGMDLNIMQLMQAREKFIRSEIFMDESELQKDLQRYYERLSKGKGECVLTFAVCFIDGLEKPLWASVTKDVLAKIQSLSPSAKTSSSPYNNGTDVHDSMKLKAAIKKLSKFLPKQGNQQLARAIELDDKAMAGSVVVMKEDGELEVIDVAHTEVNGSVQLSDLQNLYDLKREALSEDEKNNSLRILTTKETASYDKLYKLLQSK